MSPAPPKFLPVSATPQPDKRQSSQRRHSIEKESPTSVRPFLPPSRQSSKSLVRYLVEAISIGLSVYDRSLSSKWLKKKVNIKADTRKHFWMQFMTHQLEICSQLDEISASLIKMNGNPLLWLHRLTAPDVQYVCWIYSCPVTGHWFAVRSLVFSDSELGPMILVKLMDLIESTGQRCTKRILVKLVYSHYLCISFFFFFPNTAKPRASN